MKKIAVLLLAVIAAFTFAFGGCKKKEEKNAGKLFVDLHVLMPTPNERPTIDQPRPMNASRNIAKAYTALTGTEITWANEYSKPTDNITNMRSWFTQQRSVGNMPQIAFSFGTDMQEDNDYVDLTSYLDRPNKYVEGNKKWKDLFEDWVWDDPNVVDANGKIVAIPIILEAGSATAIYYNKTMFEDNDISVPETWKEFESVATALKSVPGVEHAYAPYGGDSSVSLTSWAVQFSIAPGYAKAIADKYAVDKDGNGKISTNELLRAVKEGKFNPNTCPEAKAMYYSAYKYYTTFLDKGWQSTTNWAPSWYTQKLPMKNQGLWYYTNEVSDRDAGRYEFEFDLFTPPVLQSDSDEYAADLERKTLAEGFESKVLMAFNVMKSGVGVNAELLEKAIDFLMYLTTPEAVTSLVENSGEGLPAVKGSNYPTTFDDIGWLDKEFTVISDCEWPLGFVNANTQNINAQFNEWVVGRCTDAEFFAKLVEEQTRGADNMIASMGVDTSGWDI